MTGHDLASSPERSSDRPSTAAHGAPVGGPGTVPLVVDLDGTLIDGDTLHLSLAALARQRPWVVPALPVVVFLGRARFKAFVSNRVALDAAQLRYRPDVLAFVKRERLTTRHIVLATAAHQRIADAVAGHLGIFDAVIATDGQHNAKGPGKLASIRAHLGAVEFDYIGDSLADIPVFQAARRSYLVCPAPGLEDAVRHGCRVEQVFRGQPPSGPEPAGRSG